MNGTMLVFLATDTLENKEFENIRLDVGFHFYMYSYSKVSLQASLVSIATDMAEINRSKVFTTGQARVDPEHYVIKYVGGW